MNDEYLNIEEAEARLCRIKPILETARRVKREIETIAAGYDYDLVLLEQEKPRLNELGAKLTKKLERLEEMGCYIKDLDTGVVDFLCNFEGRDVFLCWKINEPLVAHWHELNEDCPLRQQVLDLNQLDLGFDFELPMLKEIKD